MKASLAVAREQLANYESIEKEIDEAIVGMGIKVTKEEEMQIRTMCIFKRYKQRPLVQKEESSRLCLSLSVCKLSKGTKSSSPKKTSS